MRGAGPGAADCCRRIMLSTALLLCFFGRALGAVASGSDDVASFNALPNDTDDDPVQQIMAKECRGTYSAFCLKLNLVRLVGRGSGTSISILPGVSVISGGLPNNDGPISPSELLQDPDKVDGLLLSRLSDYLGSLSLNVKIMDKGVPMKFAKTYLGDSTLNATARKRRVSGAVIAAAVMSGGTLMAVAMAAMAAMAGKALMASLLALMLSAVAALKQQGGGGEKTTYEVIAKPVVSHLHTHSSEVHAGHGGHSHYRSIDNDAHDIAFAEQAPQHDLEVQDDYLPVQEASQK